MSGPIRGHVVFRLCSPIVLPLCCVHLRKKFWCTKQSAKETRDDGKYISRRVFDLISN